MARIAGLELQDKSRIDYSLTRIRGLGWALSKKILTEVNIPQEKRVKDLTPDDISKITTKLEEFLIEGELAGKIRENVTRLQRIGSYRGLRHSRSLPVRGQRTRTNARTKRGKRKTVGAFKKEVLTQMKAPEAGGAAEKK